VEKKKTGVLVSAMIRSVQLVAFAATILLLSFRFVMGATRISEDEEHTTIQQQRRKGTTREIEVDYKGATHTGIATKVSDTSEGTTTTKERSTPPTFAPNKKDFKDTPVEATDATGMGSDSDIAGGTKKGKERSATPTTRNKNDSGDVQIKTTTTYEKSDPALPKSTNSFHNSEKWLQGPRYQNINETQDPLLNQDYIRQTILNLPHVLNNASMLLPILKQTLAVEGSQFLTGWSLPLANEAHVQDEEAMIVLWSHRLLYLVLHVHQHLPALNEAQWRQQEPSQLAPNVGNFDYECAPGTKYLLHNVQNFGIGADVYWSFVPAYQAGLALGRVVHFVHSELPEGDPHTHNKHNKNIKYRMGWKQTSCDREDYQCIFAPSSPCVPTQHDIQHGYQLDQDEMEALYQHGIFSNRVQNTTVLFVVADANDIVDIHPTNPMGNKPHKAAKRILQQLMRDTAFSDAQIPNFFQRVLSSFTFANPKTMLDAFCYYALRPRPSQAQRIDAYVLDSLPYDFNPQSTVGLPIRATDKCDEESECLTFAQHMQVVQAEWGKLQHDNTPRIAELPPTIIFTTESKDMVRQQVNYEFQLQQQQKRQRAKQPNKNLTTTLFVTNKHDVLPDTGYPDYKKGKPPSSAALQADDVLLQALTSLKLQLYASRLTVANCCSNWAKTIQYYLQGGLGALASEPHVFRCLQDADDPRLRVCCWKRDDCLQKKQRDIEAFTQLQQKQA